jgi:predicted amino acid-binding ACT domain protein
VTGSQKPAILRSQIATSSSHGGRRYRPYAFTEHGALQAANILNSRRAVQMSVFVIRAFVKMRETLLGTRELAKKLAELEKQLTGRLDTHEVAIVNVLQQIMRLLNPPPPPPAPPRPKIGFNPGK